MTAEETEAMQHNFEDYQRIFDGAVAKYEGQEFFANLIQQKSRPAFPSAPRNVAIHDRIGPIVVIHRVSQLQP